MLRWGNVYTTYLYLCEKRKQFVKDWYGLFAFQTLLASVGRERPNLRRSIMQPKSWHVSRETNRKATCTTGKVSVFHVKQLLGSAITCYWDLSGGGSRPIKITLSNMAVGPRLICYRDVR